MKGIKEASWLLTCPRGGHGKAGTIPSDTYHWTRETVDPMKAIGDTTEQQGSDQTELCGAVGRSRQSSKDVKTET